ncbi:hypothetical protein QQ045_016060 [Rhodiola kirilowii]
MKVFSWNCRGLGMPRTVRALKSAIRVFSPQIVCLMETKKRVVGWDLLKLRLGFRNCLAVGSRGRVGGLAMLWDDSVDVEVVNYSQNHIDAIVRDQQEFRITLFYGEPTLCNRVDSWSLLRSLRARTNMPWVVLGDFNLL